MDRPLEGQLAIVTGSSRGLGFYAADLMAGLGASIGMCARGAEIHDCAEQIRALHGVSVLARQVDVSSPISVASFASDVTNSLGVPSMVINCAGVLGPVGRLGSIDLAEWATTLSINVVGSATVIAEFVTGMGQRGSGSIVNISGGGLGGPTLASHISAYVTSKAAVAVMTEVLAQELRPCGIRVNAVAPGAIASGFTEAVIVAGPSIAGDELYDQTLRQRAQPDPPDRFGALLVYLASPESSWLTGRLLSARWESPDVLERDRGRIEQMSRYQMRRVDEVLYSELEAPK